MYIKVLINGKQFLIFFLLFCGDDVMEEKPLHVWRIKILSHFKSAVRYRGIFFFVNRQLCQIFRLIYEEIRDITQRNTQRTNQNVNLSNFPKKKKSDVFLRYRPYN